MNTTANKSIEPIIALAMLGPIIREAEAMDLRLDTASQSASPTRWTNEKGWKSRTQIARIPRSLSEN